MPNPETVARLDTPAQVVAALPLYLGYRPTESLVVVCQHEPRGRIGLTLRYDLPPARHEEDLVRDVVARVRQETPTRLLLVVFTEEHGAGLPRTDLVDGLRDALAGELRLTDALLVRAQRFWSYLCRDLRCCPAAGTPVDTSRDDAEVRVVEAARVLDGRGFLPDREALARSLAGPVFLAAESARSRLASVGDELARLWRIDHRDARRELFDEWSEAVDALPGMPDDAQAARLVLSLEDRVLRDAVACAHEAPTLLPLLAELCRRTPEPYDAPIATLFAWVAYCDGGGAEVTIALDRAQTTDPAYSMAGLLREHLHRQTPPAVLREITQSLAEVLQPVVSGPAARRRARRSPRSRGSAS
jgi:hypothetical protein